MVNVADLYYTSVETITAFDAFTGAYLFTLDELQSVSISQGQDTEDVTGKNGRLLGRLKKNKTVTVSGDSGLVSGGMLSLQTGGKFTKKTANVLCPDYQTVIGNTATAAYTPVGTVGSEIYNVVVKDCYGLEVSKLYQSNEPVEGESFTFDPSTNLLVFAGLDDNTEIVIYYYRAVSASVLENESDSYSGVAALYIDFFAQDKCHNVYHAQIYIPKADFSGELSLDIGDSQVIHSFEASAMSGSCCVGSSNLYFTYTVFGNDTEDIEGFTILNYPHPSALTYTGSALSPEWDIDTTNMTIEGTTSAINAGTYIVYVTPNEGCVWIDGSADTVAIAWTISKAVLTTIPSQADILYYNGSSQSPTFDNFDSNLLTISGTTSGTNAGTYTVSFTPNDNVVWSDEIIASLEQ